MQASILTRATPCTRARPIAHRIRAQLPDASARIDSIANLPFSSSKVSLPLFLQVRLFPFRRRCRIIYVPAFVVDYVHGELYNEHGERMPQRFQAVISGFGEGSVAAERHFSPQKVLARGARDVKHHHLSLPALLSTVDCCMCPAEHVICRHFGIQQESVCNFSCQGVLCRSSFSTGTAWKPYNCYMNMLCACWMTDARLAHGCRCKQLQPPPSADWA